MKRFFTRLFVLCFALASIITATYAQDCAWDLSFDGIPVPGIDDPFCDDGDYLLSVVSTGAVNPFGTSALSGSFLISPPAPLTFLGDTAIIFSPTDPGIYTLTFSPSLSGACLFDDELIVDDCGFDCTANNAGVIGGFQNVCFGNTAVISSQSPNITPGSSIAYVLHSPADVNFTNPFALTNGVFPNTGAYPQNIPLCVSAIVAPGDLLIDGLPDDLTDPCVSISAACFQVVFLEEIEFFVTETCDFINDEFMVDFVVTGGYPSYAGSATYNITGDYVNPAVDDGTLYTFGPLASGSSYSIVVVTDGVGCTGSYNGIEECIDPIGCNNSAGFMSPALQTACFGSFINAPAVSTVVDAGNVLTYIIHDGNGFIGAIYGYSNNAVFTNDGSIPTNIDLFVSSVVGVPDANGNATIGGTCSVVAHSTPVRFFDPIVVAHEYVCNTADGDFVVNFTISGGGPSFPGSGHTYNVTGVVNGLLNPGISYSSLPVLDGSTYSITITDDGKGCSETILEGPIQCNKLPVELISFDGSAETNGNLLTWVTASEENNAYFTLEYSFDGLNYDHVAHIEAIGNSTSDTYYQKLDDENVQFGTTYYKLSQTDLDGSSEEIAVLYIERERNELVEIYDLYPNPVNSFLIVEVSNIFNSSFEINIINSSGKTVYAHNENGITTEFNIDASAYPPGIYILKVISDNNTSIQKFVRN